MIFKYFYLNLIYCLFNKIFFMYSEKNKNKYRAKV
jgi:hypothetical protein